MGWSLQLGYVVYSQYDPIGPVIYFSPDGGRHGGQEDGSHLRITAVGATPNPSYYTVEFPDGTKQFFEQAFSPPGPFYGESRDFTNLTAYELLFLAPNSRYGLTRVQDRFGKTVLKVNYDATHAWQPTGIVLNPDENGNGPTVVLHWTPTISSPTGGQVSWWVVDYALFPEAASSQRRVSFSYQLTSFARNPYDISNSPLNTSCYQSPATVAYAPLLHTVTYSDATGSSFTSFGYTFDYSSDDGTLQRVTLPTSGTIEYTYGHTTGTMCQVPSCNPEASISSPISAPDFPITNIQPFKRFLDHSSAVVSRTETDPTTGRSGTTSYSRQLIVKCTDVNCTDGDETRLFRKVVVTGPGNDDPAFPQPAPIGTPSGPIRYATRSYFTSPQDGVFSGIEVDRRSYAGGLDAGAAVRTLIRCYDRGARCGYRDATGNLQQYGGAIEPPQAEVAWYGAVPPGSAGGTCAGTNPPCTASDNGGGSPATDFNATVGQYRTNVLSSSLLGIPIGWSRKTVTNWTPQTGAKWMLDLFSFKQVTGASTPAPNTVTTNFTFDGDGFLLNTIVSDAYGTRTEAFTRDGLGNPAAQAMSGSGGGFSTTSFSNSHTFNGSGLALTSQRAGLPWKYFDVNRDGNTGLITASREPNSSLVRSYGYDALGRLKLVTPPGGDAATTITYVSPAETVVSRSGADGKSTWQRFKYDGFGRLIREIRAMPGGYAVRAHAYDLAGHHDFVSEWQSCLNGFAGGDCEVALPLGTTSSNFDPFGRPGTITAADASQTAISRTDGTILFSDSLERVTVSVSGSPSTTETRHDALGRVISVKEPAVGGVADETTYQYNALDKLATVSQSSQTRTFTYDAMGFLRTENTPEKGSVSYSLYDALGDVLTENLPAAGLTLNRTYDQAGRLTLLASNEGGSRQYVRNIYDQNPQFNFSFGKLTTRYSGASGSPDVSDVFVYLDPAGRLSGQTTVVTGGSSPIVTQSWQYNSLGLVAHHHHYRQDNSQAFVVSTDYSSGLPVTQYVNGIPMVKNITYRASGALASYRTGIGTGHDVTTAIGQDPSGLARTREIYATEEASGLRRFDTCGYSYDGAGNIVSMGPYCYDESGNVVAIGPQETFQYDSRSRLTFASLSGLGNQYYCYDRYGNRVDKRSDPSCPNTVWPDNRVPGVGNYDGRGNQTSNSAYAYDGLDRMVRQTAGGFTYLYDAGSERVAKASSGTWTYTFRDEARRVSAEFTNANSTTTHSRDNVFLGKLLVASYANGQLEGNGPVWTFYSSDHLGTPRLLTRIDGSVYEARKYWPFGDDASASTVQRLRFASMERDAEATRYYDHARNHEFNLGRFLTPDLALRKSYDPQTWNRYTYASSNPLRYADPDGRQSVDLNGKDPNIAYLRGQTSLEQLLRLPEEQAPLAAALAVGAAVFFAPEISAAAAIRGIPFLSPLAARVADFFDTRPVLLGETMGRVETVSSKLRTGIFRTAAGHVTQMVAENVRWLQGRLDAGARIFDIGINPDRVGGRSVFFAAEVSLLTRNGFHRVFSHLVTVQDKVYKVYEWVKSSPEQ